MDDQAELVDIDAPRAPCLGCGEIVKRHRDAWIEIGGTRSGSWLTAYAIHAAQAFADPLPPPHGEQLFLLGICHRHCLQIAFGRLRRQAVQLPDRLALMSIGHMREDEPWPDAHLPRIAGTCPFCQGHRSQATDEHIYPRWLLRELKKRGATRRVNGRSVPRIDGPTTSVCEDCNTKWLATLENDSKELILSLIDHGRFIEPQDQKVLALWATKMAVLFDSASPNPVLPRGFGHDLKITKEPHAGTHVWIAAYSDMADALTLKPWHILAKESDEVIGLCMTFTIIRVAFQVLIPLYKSTLSPLNNFMGSVEQIWPPRGATIIWPPSYYFDSKAVEALAMRVYDNREPVNMQVTLHRTNITGRPQSAQVATETSEGNPLIG